MKYRNTVRKYCKWVTFWNKIRFFLFFIFIFKLELHKWMHCPWFKSRYSMLFLCVQDNCTALHAAVSLGHVGALKLLLYHPSPEIETGGSAADSDTQHKHLSPVMTSHILNHANKDGWTAAHIAASRGYKVNTRIPHTFHTLSFLLLRMCVTVLLSFLYESSLLSGLNENFFFFEFNFIAKNCASAHILEHIDELLTHLPGLFSEMPGGFV